MGKVTQHLALVEQLNNKREENPKTHQLKDLSYDDFVDAMLVTEPDLTYSIIAINEEAGEAAGKLKRRFRGDYEEGFKTNQKLFETDVIKELGDVLYYVVAAAHSIGYTLHDVMTANKDKLIQRNQRGTIKGSGDNR